MSRIPSITRHSANGCRMLKYVVVSLLLGLLPPHASLALDPHPAIASILAEVEESMLYDYVGQLSGEFPVLIGGEPYIITTRYTQSGDPIVKATQYVYEHMESLGLQASYQEWSGCMFNNDISGRNVVGEKTGTTLPGEIVLVTAHLDSMPSGIASHGADDNASGVAAVLAASDLLSRHNFQRTIRFVLTTGEEQGLCGSRAYAADAYANNDNIVAVCNLDMIAWDGDESPLVRLHIRVPGDPGYESDLAIADTFIDVVHAYGLDLDPVVSADSNSRSDQYPFWVFGFPAILAIEDDQGDFNPYYHTLDDGLSSLNIAFFANNVEATLGTIAHLAAIANSESEITVSGGGASVVRTAGIYGHPQAGYASLQVDSGADPYGVAVLTFSQDGIVVGEAAIPPSPPTTSARIFIDYRSGADAVPGLSEAGSIDVNTGIAVVNSGLEPAGITYTLRDIDGKSMTSGDGTIAAGRYFASFIDQLRERAGASNFRLPGDFPVRVQFGSLEISSSQPVSVLALRGTVNQRGEFLMTTTPVADLTRPHASGPLYFPQFVDGGGYTTSLVLLNTSGAVQSGILEIMDPEGEPLVVGRAGGTADSSFPYSIQPGGAFRFQTDGFPSEARAGWVRVTPEPGSSTPTGSGVFGYNPGAILVSESGIPSAAPTTRARIYVDLSRRRNTGLAIANANDSAAEIALNAFERDGATPAGNSVESLRLPANGHMAAFADQFVSGLPEGFTGVLDISSPEPFAALTLRSLNNERNEFLMTTFPVADANAAAPSPIVFPQVVRGGGYATEFILISPGGASGATLHYFDENGAPAEFGE